MRQLLLKPVKWVDSVLARTDRLIPPKSLRMKVGPFGLSVLYKATGRYFFSSLRKLCDLKPTQSVLDIGCGCGLVSIHLAKYLEQSSRYEGFDISETLIGWCKENISSKYPNFHFQHADLYNKDYNPEGKVKASSWKFPYPKESFDVIFAKSVFTHLLPKDMENYLEEVARVLKKGGKCLITFFLHNSRLPIFSQSRKSLLNFAYDFGKFKVVDPDLPEKAVCYEEEYVRTLYQKHGLRLLEPIRYGIWRRRFTRFPNIQDMIVASKVK